jgi:dTDP-4-amino-4,6-dideoxygalactose transaminase
MISSGLSAFVAELRRRGLFVIEDAAHAPGAELAGRLAGSLADAGCFSFYPTKIMTTGEGGMVTTSSGEIAESVRSTQNRGRNMKSETEIYASIGRNNRFPEVAAAMGLSQLRCLPAFLEARRAVAQVYDEMLTQAANEGVPCRPLLAPAGSRPSYWRYSVFLDFPVDRPQLRSLLAQDRIAIDWAYDPPVHLQPAFQRAYGTRPGMLPRSEALMSRHICLPVHARLGPIDAEYVAQRFIARVRELGQT